MLEALQLLFLLSLAGSVVWLAYLARHQDAAAPRDPERFVRDPDARSFRRS